MLERVLRIISQVMEVQIDQLNEESSPETVENWDSLRHINLILALEEEFNIAFSDEEIIDMVSVQFIVKTLKEKCSQHS